MALAVLEFVKSLFWVVLAVGSVAGLLTYMDHRAQRKQEERK